MLTVARPGAVLAVLKALSSPPGPAGVALEPAGLVASVVLVAGLLVGAAVVGSLAGVAVAGGVVVAGMLLAGVVVGALVGAAVVEGAAVVVGWSAPGVPALVVGCATPAWWSPAMAAGGRPAEQRGDHQGGEQQTRR